MWTLYLGTSFTCPTDQSNYQSIDGGCYYFEAQSFQYQEAQDNCGTKFQGGRLFEPRSISINDKVAQAAFVALGSVQFWLGLADEATEGLYDLSYRLLRSRFDINTSHHLSISVKLHSGRFK